MSEIRTRLLKFATFLSALSLAASCAVEGTKPKVSSVDDTRAATQNTGATQTAAAKSTRPY